MKARKWRGRKYSDRSMATDGWRQLEILLRPRGQRPNVTALLFLFSTFLHERAEKHNSCLFVSYCETVVAFKTEQPLERLVACRVYVGGNFSP